MQCWPNVVSTTTMETTLTWEQPAVNISGLVHWLLQILVCTQFSFFKEPETQTVLWLLFKSYITVFSVKFFVYSILLSLLSCNRWLWYYPNNAIWTVKRLCVWTIINKMHFVYFLQCLDFVNILLFFLLSCTTQNWLHFVLFDNSIFSGMYEMWLFFCFLIILILLFIK
jgi:hypothetical protein